MPNGASTSGACGVRADSRQADVLVCFHSARHPDGSTRITLRQIAAILDINERTAQRHAHALRSAGMVERHGRTWMVRTP